MSAIVTRMYSGKTLYVGHLNPGQTSLMRADALERLGIKLVPFNARHFLEKSSFLERRISDVIERAPYLSLLNNELIKLAERERPNVVWFDKQEYIFGDTIKRLKQLGAFLVFYTPDPYFQHSWHQTRTMTANFPDIDLFVTTKSYELEQYRTFGDTFYMPHGYCDRTHRNWNVPENDRIDFGFIGSWEPRREAFLERISERGLTLRIWGFGWDHVKTGRAGIRTKARLSRMANGAVYKIKKSEALAEHIYPGEVYADAYAQAISAARISPGLLRTTLYPDQHTTRTFEIPACGSMLLAERTTEHEELFEEDKEAVFFSEEEEMVEKAAWYTDHPKDREKITVAGYQRCLNSGYSYKERLREVFNYISRVTGD